MKEKNNNKKQFKHFTKIFTFNLIPIFVSILFFLTFVLFNILIINKYKNINLNKFLNIFLTGAAILLIIYIIFYIILSFKIKKFANFLIKRLNFLLTSIEESIETGTLENFPSSKILEFNSFLERIKFLIEENIILKEKIIKKYEDINNLLNSINGYLWIGKWDTTKNQFGVNKYEILTDGIKKITGYSAKEFINSKTDLWYNIVFKKDLDIIKENEKKLINGQSVISQYRIVTKNNKIKWILEVTYPIFNINNSELNAIYGLVLDITRQVQITQDLQKSLSRFKKFIENSQDGILIVDSEGKIIDWNTTLSKIMEKKSEEVIGKYIWDIQFELLPIEKRTKNRYLKIKNSLSNLYKTKNASWLNKTLEQTIFTSSNKTKYILSTTFIIDNENFMTGSIIKDITDLKKYQLEANKKQKLESIGLLASGIAHDFNNFLTIISGNLSLLKIMLNQKDNLFEKEEILNIINDGIWASNKAKNLSTQLLTFSKEGSLEKKEVNIYKLINDCMSFSLTGKNIDYKIIASDKNINIHCDENQFFQIFNNLVMNSIYSINEKGNNNGIIKINIKKLNKLEITKNNNLYNYIFEYDNFNCNEYIYISFYDNGNGIDNKVINKIFDPFFTTKEHGTGMGLSMVYSIIRKHNGFITCSSKKGEYALFEILLPIIQKEEKYKIDNKKEFIFSNRKKRNIYINKKTNNLPILVLEDDKKIQDLILKFSKQLGIKAIITSDGQKTFKIFKELIRKKQPPKLIFLDLTIKGGLGGLSTNYKINKLKKGIPTIVMSGYSNNIIISDYKKHNFSFALIKPFEFNKFKLIVSNFYTIKNDL